MSAHAPTPEGLSAVRLPWRGPLSLFAPLPWGSRLGLFAAALVVLLAACGAPLVGLEPVAADAPGAPKLTSVSPAEGPPAGGQRVTLHGEGFAPGMTVWLGEALVYDAEVAADGKSLTFVAPATRAGVVLDVAVGRTEGFGDVTQRVVLPKAYRTGGLSRAGVAWVGLGLAALALLGTPLYAVIAATACLGLFLEVQTKADLGFFTSGERAGAGANLFISWLGPMGDSPLFIAIPLFTFAGTLMSESRAPTRLINLCRALIGWMPGGLALVTLIACSFFTAFTGASGVTIIALGGLLFPILLRERYPDRFSLGLLTTGGSLGLLFPPSLPVIVYGLVAGVDVGRLFQAALVPGILLIVFLGVTAFVVALRRDVPRHPFTFGELGRAARGALWELPLPVIVVGGIYSGLITAAEAAAVTALYVIVTTVVIYRDVELRALPGIVRRTVVLVGAILVIMGTALGFADWLSLERIPQQILAAMQEHIDDRLTFLLMLNGFLLIVGCLMDIFSATLVVVPLIAPVAQEFGVDPYHLAVIFLVNLEIGYSTPPVGINLFIASLRFRRPVFELYRASILFILVMLAALAVVTYIPACSLGLFDGLPQVKVEAPGDGPAPLTVQQYDDVTITAEVRAGDVTIADARAARDAALAALRAAEQELGLEWGVLDQRVEEAERALDVAADRQARASARAALKAAVADRAPLAPAAEAFERARQQLDELQTLERTLRWRSRLGGVESTGATFSTSLLGPGTHVVSVTAQDGRRHVAQDTITIVVEPAPEQPTDGGGDWGEGGDWGGGDWGEGDWGDSGGDEAPQDPPADGPR